MAFATVTLETMSRLACVFKIRMFSGLVVQTLLAGMEAELRPLREFPTLDASWLGDGAMSHYGSYPHWMLVGLEAEPWAITESSYIGC